MITTVKNLFQHWLGRPETQHPVRVSTEKAQKPTVPHRRVLLKTGQRLGGVVNQFTHGAALIKLNNGQYAFLPDQHISWVNPCAKAEELFKVGDQIEVVVLEVKVRAKGQIYIEVGYRELNPDKKQDLVRKYSINTRYIGTVVKIVGFGAFVRLEGGIDGLVHNSEISWTDPLATACQVFKRGDKVEVVVLQVDLVKNQLSLSYRLAQPNPWDSAENELPPNTRTSGSVIRRGKLGLFVKLPNGCQGLIDKRHLPVPASDAAFAVGEMLNVIIVRCEPLQQRFVVVLDSSHVGKVSTT